MARSKMKRYKKKHIKGGTKSEERRRDTISKAIQGKNYKYRKSVNDIISKLEKTLGNEFIGPPEFKEKSTWTSKYEELLDLMPKLAKDDNDKTLNIGGWTYNKLLDLKIQHDKKVAEHNISHRQLTEMLSQLTPVSKLPKVKKTNYTLKKSRKTII